MLTLRVVPPDTGLGRQALYGFFATVAEIFFGRPVTDDEIDAAMHENQVPGLEPPTGLLVVALDEAMRPPQVLGCVALRLLDDRVGEVKHLHVVDAARGRGLGDRLMNEIESRSRAAGCTTLRLDTRHALAASRRLYERRGFVEVPRFNENPYAEHWYAKALD